MRTAFAFAFVLAACTETSGPADADGDGLVGDDDCDDKDAGVGGPEPWLVDGDHDGYAGTTPVRACERPDAAADLTGDCDDADDQVHPGVTEACNGVDDDCDGEIDEDATTVYYADADGDGFGDAASPTAACEPPDGYVTTADDCDDADAGRFPDAPERCDGADDDCDGDVDEDAEGTRTWYADGDGDGFGDPGDAWVSCEEPPDRVVDGTDCDDARSAVNPGAIEVCNGTDDDCDGAVDEADAADAPTWYVDVDGDGWGTLDAVEAACDAPTGYAAYDGDCDDTDTRFNPGAVEADCADPADYNCDGSVAYADADADGYAACEECDDGDAAVSPGAVEVCNGTDDDCDGTVDEADAADASTWYADTDADGYGDAASTSVACDAPAGSVPDATDCDDGDAAINPGALERCNGVDDDCDTEVDEDSAIDADTWYGDGDGDGYGDAAVGTTACDAPSGYVADATDCDDARRLTHPGATEYCNTTDDDCDGVVDDGAADALTWWADGDADGYGDASTSTVDCSAPLGYVRDDDDCDDTDGAVNPAATEVCNRVDDDCDGTVDGVSTTYDFATGVDSAVIQLNGDATWRSTSGGYLELVGLTGYGGGTAWWIERIDATAFEVSFSFQIHGGSGADGISFAWLDETDTTSIGALGGSLGLYGLSGYAVEFDTYYNSGTDPSENHVALIDAATFTNYATSSAIPELEDSGWHDATISNSGGTVEVWVDGTRYINHTLSSYTLSEAMVGFTAATGGSTNYHDIDDVSFACP